MDMRYPIGYKIEADQLEDGNWRLFYTEKFAPDDVEAAQNSIKQFKLLAAATVILTEGELRVTLVDSRHEVMNFLGGEFLCASSLGRMTLTELLATAVLRIANAEKQHDEFLKTTNPIKRMGIGERG